MSYKASTATLGNISEMASLYSTSRIDIDSLSLSSNLDPTPTSSSSSFKTISTGMYRMSSETYPKMPDFNGTKKHAVLAEAEDLDDDIEYISVKNMNADDVEYMDNENLIESIEVFNESNKENKINKKIIMIKKNFDPIDTNNKIPSITETPKSTILLPSEKVSDAAREYWATLDLYNNSKMAFNKRTKSVRLKREKLNKELLNTGKVNMTPVPQRLVFNSDQHLTGTQQQSHNPETCKCVKCSIVYHETIIKNVSGSCRSGNSNNNTTSTEIRKDLFETKLFDIKNELVSLSETSLDVFQLLLQLSDTMLELNSQLNTNSLLSSRQNSNSQLVFINQLISSNLSLNKEYLAQTTATNNTTNMPKPHNNRRIEDFLQKTLNSVQYSSNTTNNSRRNNSSTFVVESSKNFDGKIINEEDSDHLIENLYDKTSVTQFVDSFFKNDNNASNNRNNNSSESSFSIHSQNSGSYSLLSTLNKNSNFAESDFIIDENPYQCIDDDLMGKVECLKLEAKAKEQAKFEVLNDASKQSSNAESVSLNSDSLSISSTQSSLNRSQPADKSLSQTHSATNKNESSPTKQLHKNSILETNSSNSSSSGRTERTGSSSICSSSNIDLSYLPSTSSSITNITNNDHSQLTSSSTTNSLASNESQTINRRCLIRTKDDYNSKITDNLIQSYRRNQSPPQITIQSTKKSIIPELPLVENCLSQNMQQNIDQHVPLYGSYQRNNNKTSAGSIYGTSVLQANGSTRRKPSFKFDSNILNRVQTMGLEKSIDESKTLETSQTGSRSFRFGDRPVNHHQVSLDSGIYLPTEIEEH